MTGERHRKLGGIAGTVHAMKEGFGRSNAMRSRCIKGGTRRGLVAIEYHSKSGRK